jgi:N-formylglutamate amidohydrolase
VLVDRLFAAAPACGAPLIVARYARAWVDLNREAYELDPRLFDGPLPAWVRTQTPRAAAGLGSVARVVAEGQEIYRGKLAFADAAARIEAVHRPYHAAVAGLLDAARARFGVAILIDAHSMPAAALGVERGRRDTPHAVLGDRFGAACAPAVAERVERLLQGEGLRTVRNTPYAGGFTTEHHGRPAQGRHALQIELLRGLYLDEATLAPTAAFDALKARLGRVIAGLCAADWSALAA